MFDSSSPYSLVQKRKNKYSIRESFVHEYIFKFHCHNEKCCIKYVVSIKEYPNNLLTLDYYPKISLTPNIQSMDDIQDLRYRMLTKQNSFGVIGGTIMRILDVMKKQYGLNTWGFLAANLINEKENSNNKRYQVYKEILGRSLKQEYEVYGNQKNSTIFVIPAGRKADKDKIIEQYENIFAEIN